MVVTDLTTFVYAGNRRVLKFTVGDEDASAPAVKNLTGLDVKFSIARLAAGVPIVGLPLVDFALSHAQVSVPNPADGIVLVELLKADTVSLAPGGIATTYYFELEIFDSVPNGTVAATGEIEVRPNVVNA